MKQDRILTIFSFRDDDHQSAQKACDRRYDNCFAVQYTAWHLCERE